MDKNEKNRIKKKTEAILNVLRMAGDKGVTNVELSNIALRYGGNLGELYRDGYKIERTSLGNGVNKYTLISEPKDIVKRDKAIDKLFLEINKVGTVDVKSLKEIMDRISVSVKYKANTYK